MENEDFKKDLVIFYESRIWNKADASIKIERYVDELIKFRGEPILQETFNILQSLIYRMKETIKVTERTEGMSQLRQNGYKQLSLKIWSHWKKDGCRKYDERLFERQANYVMHSAERGEDKHFIEKYKNSKIHLSF